MTELDARLARYRRLLDSGLDDLLDCGPPFRSLYDMMAYHFGRLDTDLKPCTADSGKCLRPAMCFLVCETVGGTAEAAISGALAVELLHNFSLIHDDIQDGSALRRHRAAVWTVWGVPHAINVGDGMFALAHLALTGGSVDDVTRVRVERVFSRTCVELCEGQFLDLSFERTATVSLSEYILMAQKKTAALFGCAAEMGALLGGARHETARLLGRFGRTVGEAFQAYDDILGVWGDEQRIGKPAADVRDRKRGLPAVLAFAGCEGADLARLADLYAGEGQLDEDAVDWVLRLFDRVEVRRQADSIADGRLRAAEALLAEAVPGGSTVELRRLISSIPRSATTYPGNAVRA